MIVKQTFPLLLLLFATVFLLLSVQQPTSGGCFQCPGEDTSFVGYITDYYSSCTPTYEWATWTEFTGNRATGTILVDGREIRVEMSANYNFGATGGIFNYRVFNDFEGAPLNRRVPRTTWSRGAGGATTMCFSETVSNPTLLLASIGDPRRPVSLSFSRAYRPIFDGGGMTFTSDTSLIGREGYTVLVFPGEFECVTVFSSTPEYYTNITWGLNPPEFPVDIVGNLESCESTILTASGGVSYAWSGGAYPDSSTNTFLESGTYFLTVTDSAGCQVQTSRDILLHPDSIVTTFLTQTICAGDDYLGYSETGTYLDTLQTEDGCDNVRTLQLSVLEPIATQDSLLLAAGESYSWKGTNIRGDTTLCETFTIADNCDSTHCLTLQFEAVFDSCATNRRANIWYFGHNAGLDFNTTPPTVLSDGQANTFEGVATIADEQGNLLFYTDGRTVWNRQHQRMPNGMGLMGNPSSTQSGVIVPVPDRPDLYYLFTVDANENNYRNGMRYSIVDMTLQNGLGNVTEKNAVVMANSSEKICAVRHANNRDVWVLGKEQNTNMFRAHLVTADGLKIDTVVNQIGASTSNIGYLKPAANGRKIANADGRQNGFEIFDFNPGTGILSNPLYIQSTRFRIPYGVEFSKNGKLLYGTSVQEPSLVLQMNLQAGDSDAVLASTTELAVSNLRYKFGAIQLGPDGRMYITSGNQWPTPPRFASLSVIEFPDQIGPACSFREDVIDVSPGRTRLGLPTFIQSYFEEFKLQIEGTSRICSGSTSTYQINAEVEEGTSIRWSTTNDRLQLLHTDSTVVLVRGTQPGAADLTVEYIDVCQTIARDTFPIQVLPPSAATEVVTICAGETYQMGGREYAVSGIYIDTLRALNGCDSLVTLELIVLPQLGSVRDTILCAGDSLWFQNRWIRQSGQYRASLISRNGCDSLVTLNLVAREASTVEVEGLMVVCPGESTQVAVSGSFQDINWSTGQKGRTVDIANSGTYQVTVTDETGCLTSKRFDISEKAELDWTFERQPPSCLFATDGLIDVIVFDPDSSLQYTLGTNLTQEHGLFENLESGTYPLAITSLDFCQVDTVLSLPSGDTDFSMEVSPSNVTASLGESVELRVETPFPPPIIRWEPSEFLDCDSCAIVYSQPNRDMIYVVRAGPTEECLQTDTVRVDVRLPDLFYVPMAFSPNGDGRNDLFSVYPSSEVESVQEFQIFDRWGNLLRQLEDCTGPDCGWDGTDEKGQSVDPGVYVYSVRITFKDGTIVLHKGDVMLVR